MPSVIMLTRLAPAAVTLPPAIVSTEDFRQAGETLPAMFENVPTGIEELASVVPAGGLDQRGLEGRGLAQRAADRGRHSRPWQEAAANLGLHAFLLVGYDDKGFLVRNSWGADWGGWIDRQGRRWPGIARWAYDDWQRNAIDAWALRLAVSPPDQLHAVGGYQTAGGVAVASVGRTPPRIAINGHYLHVKDGRLVQSGVFNSDRDSVGETAEVLATTTDYRHLVLIVESGLDAMETMTHRAAVLTPYMKALQIYPVFVFWREDVFALTSELLDDRCHRLEARTGGFAALTSLLLDRFAREFMPPVWRTFEGEVERAFSRQHPR